MQVFRGLSAVIPLLEFFVVTLGIGLPGFSVSLALVWSRLAVDSFAFALTVVATTAVANKSAMKPGVVSGTNSTFQVSLIHYDL